MYIFIKKVADKFPSSLSYKFIEERDIISDVLIGLSYGVAMLKAIACDIIIIHYGINYLIFFDIIPNILRNVELLREICYHNIKG